MFLLKNIFIYFSSLLWLWEIVVTGPKLCLSYLQSFVQSLVFAPFHIVSYMLKIPSLLIFIVSINLELCYYFCKTFSQCIFSGSNSADSHREKQTKRDELKGLLKFDQLLHEKPNPRISVIIPCYNEAESIAETIKKAMDDVNVEIIIADGDSKDKTLNEVNNIFDRKNIKILEKAGETRSECMNTGAMVASGEILLFLHADTMLPHEWGVSVRNALATDKDMLVGAFAFKFPLMDTNSSTLLKAIEWGTNLRSSFLHLPYGDQALFCYKNVFATLGKFPVQPLMEDYDFVLHAGSIGKVHTMSKPVITSARRWISKGIISNTLWNSFVIFGHTVGVPAANLARWYYGPGGKKTY